MRNHCNDSGSTEVQNKLFLTAVGETEITSVSMVRGKQLYGDVWLADSISFLETGPLLFPNSLIVSGSFRVTHQGGSTNFKPETVQILFDMEVISYTDRLFYSEKDGRWYYALNVGLVGCGNSIEFDVILMGREYRDDSFHLHSTCIGHISGRRKVVPVSYNGGIKPLLMSGLGRSGTTLMMELLLQHKKIVGFPKHPYENQPAQYWLHAFRVLSSPSDKNSDALMVAFQQRINRIGRNPFHDPLLSNNIVEGENVITWFEGKHTQNLGKFFLEQIEQYYRALGGEVGKSGAVYFVEKTQPNAHSLIFHELYGDVHEIFIIRHPFDVLCSVRSFFPENQFYQSDTYIEALRHGYNRMLDRIEGDEGKRFIVDYDRLIKDPTEIMNAIFDFLEFPKRKRVAKKTQNKQGHITSESANSSLGRWKTELTAREVAIAKQEFTSVMGRIKTVMPSFDLGYEVAESV